MEACLRQQISWRFIRQRTKDIEEIEKIEKKKKIDN